MSEIAATCITCRRMLPLSELTEIGGYVQTYQGSSAIGGFMLGIDGGSVYICKDGASCALIIAARISRGNDPLR